MFTKLAAASAAIMLISVGCGDNMSSTAPNADQAGQNLAAHGWGGWGQGRHGMSGQEMTFKVRIENVSTPMTLQLSNGETAPAPHSPGVWTVTRLFNPLFAIGKYDRGEGLEAQAEDGDPSMLAESMAGKEYVKSSGVFAIPVGDDTPQPATPGKAFEFTVTASPGDHLSFTTMFGQSNDLFYSPGAIGIPLFDWKRQPLDGDVTHWVHLWDAGTEVNQEPGLGDDQAPRQSAPNTGESEHERVLPVHDQYTYPVTDEVIKVTITPVDDVS